MLLLQLREVPISPFGSVLNRSNGIYHPINPVTLGDQARLYHRVREKENRIYTDEIVKNLPEIEPDHPHFQEWKIRKRSLDRFLKYLKDRNSSLEILDLGCGNGWLANRLTEALVCDVYGVDIHEFELVQGARVFRGNDRLRFLFGDIFDDIFPPRRFDIILLAASIQYFFDLKKLLKILLKLLKDNGEIHILDSPFYRLETVAAAKERTRNYFQGLGIVEMVRYYHHPLREDLVEFHPTLLNDPDSVVNFIRRFFCPEAVSPFPWIRFQK